MYFPNAEDIQRIYSIRLRCHALFKYYNEQPPASSDEMNNVQHPFIPKLSLEPPCLVINQSVCLPTAVPIWRSCRGMLVVTGTVGFIFMYLLRINLSVAMVCMIKEKGQGNVTLPDTNQTYWVNSTTMEDPTAETDGCGKLEQARRATGRVRVMLINRCKSCLSHQGPNSPMFFATMMHEFSSGESTHQRDMCASCQHFGSVSTS